MNQLIRMNSRLFSNVLLIGLLACLCACETVSPVVQEEGRDPEEQLVPETPQAPDTPETPEYYPAVRIALTTADEKLRNASNAFGLSVFDQLLKADDGQKDVVFSPLSLSLALSMAADGAAGDTYKQFADVLGWGSLTREEVGAFYAKMIAGLVEADRQVSFISSNSLWAAKDFSLKDAYKEQLEESFAAESYSVDFSLPETLGEINDWCAAKTDGKIKKMLESLDARTRIILINALLFKAPWSLEWEVKAERPFQARQAAVKKDYLFADGQFSYRAFEGYEVVGVPYGNRAYEIDIILPKAGKTVAGLLASLQPDALRFLHSTPVELYLPKFSLEYSTEDALMGSLEGLGLKLPFQDGKADFSGISAEKLYISKIIQKTRVDVSENGTEFAAVTEINGAATALPGDEQPKKVVFDANRPFAFLIRETSSNAILLIGTLSE